MASYPTSKALHKEGTTTPNVLPRLSLGWWRGSVTDLRFYGNSVVTLRGPISAQGYCQTLYPRYGFSTSVTRVPLKPLPLGTSRQCGNTDRHARPSFPLIITSKTEVITVRNTTGRIVVVSTLTIVAWAMLSKKFKTVRQVPGLAG